MGSKQFSIPVIYGLTAGLALIGYTLLLYHYGMEVYLSQWARAGYLFIFAMAASAAIAEKKAGGGYLDFRAALKAAFTVVVISLALRALIEWVLMNYIDVSFRQAVDKEVLKRKIEWWKNLHYQEDQINKMIADEQGQSQFTFGTTLFGLMLEYVACFIPAVLIAVIVKKKKQ